MVHWTGAFGPQVVKYRLFICTIYTVHLDRCLQIVVQMFNASFVLNATENVEFNENIDTVQASTTEYYTAKELEEIHLQKIDSDVKKQKKQRQYVAFQKQQKRAKRISYIPPDPTSPQAILRTLLASYKRHARNERKDLMQEVLQTINQDIAPKLSASERRKLWKVMSSHKTKFAKQTEVVLLPTWTERRAAKAAKSNWAQVKELVCVECGVSQSDRTSCGSYGSGFLPLVPCGHLALCEKCSDVCSYCPSCHASIDHAMKQFLRPRTPVVSELNEIMGSIRRGRSVNLSLVRRASLARVRDARHVAGGTGVASVESGKRTKGDRTSKILFDLGTACKMSPARIKNLDTKLEHSISKACHAETSAEGTKEMLQLFSQLIPSKADVVVSKHNQTTQSDSKREDMFCLTRKDNTSWVPPRKGLQVVWNYDEHVPIDDATTQLPYVAQNGHARMERFRGVMNPRIIAMEMHQLRHEKKIRKIENRELLDDHLIKIEIRNMIDEDHVGQISRYWNKSVAERENILDGTSGSEGQDLDSIDEMFEAINRNYKHRYKKGWDQKQRSSMMLLRGARSAQFAVRMSELQRISTMLLCYQKSCKDRNVGVLRELEHRMAVSDRLTCIRASQVSVDHVECLTDLLFSCGNVGHESMERFDLSFAMLNVSGTKRLAASLVQLSHLRRLSIKNCQSNDDAVPRLIEVIQDQCPMLTEIDMSHNKMSEPSSSNKCFLNSLTKLIAGGTLQHLCLSHNNLGPNTGIAIGHGIVQDTSNIQYIDVSWNNLQREGVSSILYAAAGSAAGRGGGGGGGGGVDASSVKSRLQHLNVGYNGFRLEEIRMPLNKAKNMSDIKIIVESKVVKYQSLHPAKVIQQVSPIRRSKQKGGGKKSASKNKKKK